MRMRGVKWGRMGYCMGARCGMLTIRYKRKPVPKTYPGFVTREEQEDKQDAKKKRDESQAGAAARSRHTRSPHARRTFAAPPVTPSRTER